MKAQETTQEHINGIIEFCQAIHARRFGKQRDALSELVDAMCLTGAISSFPMLSLCQSFQRQWHSLYKAVERGTIEDERLSRHLAQQVPAEGIQYYALDGSAWPRSRARTMDDRQYVYHPTAAVKSASICIGYPYSLLDWVPEAHGSWSLLVSVKRIPSQMTAGEMGDMGAAAVALGQADQAREWLFESLAISRQVADRTQEILCLGHLGWLEVKFGRASKALEHLEAALILAEGIDSRAEQSWLRSGLAEVHRLTGDMDLALECGQQALTLAQTRERACDQRLARGILAELGWAAL